MQIQVNTDHHIEGREALAAHVKSVVEHALGRSSDRVTRVEVHLGDEHGRKGGKGDKRCVMEARLQGRDPLAVTEHADTLHQAIDGASRKLTRMVESTIERMHDHKVRATAPPDPQADIPEK